ncbi:hypothetical protein POPTR_013G101050v4 [Populus trichocarpa]|uniref:Uncharacterized protein n=1 Tax=Populus trichocarpa TaxID=3694 RepID=A0A3N7HFL3_POPTR|nr:hypothetical protein BDE02_13G091100 [Populus trichocarpa]RQO99228.1 hypothetical protein POPTR_013G101050v4 [Populus trichocarpa]
MSYCGVDRACVTSAADIQKQWLFRLIGSDFCEDRSRQIFEEAAAITIHNAEQNDCVVAQFCVYIVAKTWRMAALWCCYYEGLQRR